MAAQPDTPNPSLNRRDDRIDLPGGLRGEVMVFQPMSVREISLSGAQVETTFPLQLDSLHDLRLELGSRVLVTKGRVVHCSIADVDHEAVTYRSGLEFIAPDPHVRRAIDEFVGSLQADRP